MHRQSQSGPENVGGNASESPLLEIGIGHPIRILTCSCIGIGIIDIGLEFGLPMAICFETYDLHPMY